MAEGRFVEINGPVVRVLTAEGQTTQVPIDLLTDADRQFAETLARGGEPGTLPPGAWEVASDKPQLLAVGDRTAMLLIDGQKLHLLSPDGAQRKATHDLGGEITALAERPAYLVAAIGKELQLLDKQSFQPTAKHELWRYQRIRDLAVHPTRPVSYVSVENGREAILRDADERQRIVAVDETTGDVAESDDVFGKFLLVDPAGKFLYVGYRQVYESGGDIHINPDGNVIQTPNWENVDILRRFRIEGSELSLDEEFRDAGANGQGMVLSPDGRRISYLSYTGYPTFSGNVAALDAGNFKRKPVSFPMKDKSDCRRMVYHPVLPLVASPTTGGAVLYSAETGKVVDGVLPASPELEGAVVEALAFAPTGKHLVFVISKAGGPRYVHTAALRLSAAQQAAVAAGPPPAAAPPAAMRLWTDASGNFQMQAVYRGLDNGKVMLEKPDGSVIRVPLEKLSAADRALVGKQSR